MRNYWGTSPIGSRRTKPPISTPDAGVTGAGWSGGNGQASRRGAERSEIAKSRGRTGLATADTTRGPLHPLRSATPITGHDTRSEEVHCLRIGCTPNHKNKRGICETTTDTTRRPLHPLRGATPDQKGCTAYGSGAVPPITRTNAESARRSPIRTRPRKHAQFDEVLRRRERDTHQAPGARAPGASTVTPQTAATSQTGARAPGAAAQSQLSRRSTSRRRGRR